MKYEGKLFIVTGGASGLGAGTVKHLLKLGGHVAAIDLNIPETSPEERLRYFTANVASPDEVAAARQEILQWAEQRNLHLEGIVTCAGFLGPAKILSKSLKPMPLANFRKVLDISVTGTVDVLCQFLPHMATQTPDGEGHRGVLITVSSVSAFEGQEGQVAYSAAKGAVASMTLPMARDLASRGIRVVSIAPGIFDTNMVANMPEAAQKSVKKGFEFPPRGGKAEEFAALVESIVDNHMLNGTVIRIDGAGRFPARL